jgi:diaminopimelate epimerase
MPNGIRLERVTFTRPAGNDTAMIWDRFNRDDYPSVAAMVQQGFPNIEQVMFVENDPETGLVRGQMAGGEFCANATRSLAYILMEGKSGLIDMDVSGSSSLIQVNVQGNDASLEIDLKSLGRSLIKNFASGQCAVDMGGIIHVVAFEGDALFNVINSISNIEQKKYYIRKLLSAEPYNQYPACGMMLARKRNTSEIEIDPFVYVRDTGTLYNETACASGSAAVAVICAFQQQQAIQNLNIQQPSCLWMRTNVAYRNGNFESVTVGGEISVFYDGELILAAAARDIQNAP